MGILLARQPREWPLPSGKQPQGTLRYKVAQHLTVLFHPLSPSIYGTKTPTKDIRLLPSSSC